MWNEIFFGIIATGLLIILGHRLGRWLFPQETREIATLLGILCAIAMFSITGAGVFYLLPVSVLSLGVSTFGLAVLILFVTQHYTIHTESVKTPKFTNIRGSILPLTIGTIALISWWGVLLSTPITTAVRTPWEILSPTVIIAPILALLASFILLKKNAFAGTALLGAALFSIFISATILFPLGYGFDPFLHRATIFHIAEHGTITPKPLYYIGEYALELYTNLLGGVSIFSIDTLLLPLLATLTFLATYRRLPSGLAILLIPFGAFLTTTPQSLGYLFALLTIISSPKNPEHKKELVAPGIFAVAACIAHPIAGVPAVLFLALHWSKQTAVRALTILLSIIALPGLFVAQALMSHAELSVSLPTLENISQLPLNGFLWSQGNTWLDMLYLLSSNIGIGIILLCCLGIATSRSSLTQLERNSTYMSAALLVSFFVTSLCIDFTYLISYERNDFALRLLFLATLFALPLASKGIHKILEIATAKRLALPAGIMFTLFLAASLYTLFPRHDGYARSAAFNVSRSDINTVYAIHAKETEDSDYIVLANQTTSAVALQEFGFRKYYHSDIFYYPIPTGGVLYQYYLSMVNDGPKLETVQEAMATAGVQKAYFVVHNYWWKHEAIVEQAKQLTDDWFTVDNGNVMIFIFTSQSSASPLE